VGGSHAIRHGLDMYGTSTHAGGPWHSVLAGGEVQVGPLLDEGPRDDDVVAFLQAWLAGAAETPSLSEMAKPDRARPKGPDRPPIRSVLPIHAWNGAMR
jgi:hypothetical protein